MCSSFDPVSFTNGVSNRRESIVTGHNGLHVIDSYKVYKTCPKINKVDPSI